MKKLLLAVIALVAIGVACFGEGRRRGYDEVVGVARGFSLETGDVLVDFYVVSPSGGWSRYGSLESSWVRLPVRVRPSDEIHFQEVCSGGSIYLRYVELLLVTT